MREGKIKGTIMMQIVKYLRSRKEEVRKVLPSHLADYLETRVLSSSWYPEKDYLDLMRVLVPLWPHDAQSGISAWEAAARASSTAYFEGPYASMVRVGDPSRTLANLEALWRLRHDTGTVRVTTIGENESAIELSDYSLVAPEVCELVQGTIWGFLHFAEAGGIEIRHLRCRARGDAVCEWRAHWAKG